MLHRVLTAVLACAVAGAQEKLPFRVVFAHDEGEALVKVWTAFLADATAGVEAVPLARLDEASLAKGEVVIVNGRALLRDGEHPRVAKLGDPPSLAMLQKLPVVLVGGYGGMLADAHQLKLGWSFG